MKIILDTDFGDDIDDTFALYYLLQTAGDNIALVLSCFGQTPSRAKLICNFLQKCKRTDVPVGIGADNPDYRAPFMDRVFKNEDFIPYPCLYQNGIQKAKEIIEKNDDVIIIAIGPLTNLSHLATICEKARKVPIYSMLGSIYKGYHGASSISKEWNVIADIPAVKNVLTLYENLCITPLDTCGLIRFEKNDYKKIQNLETPLAEYYKKWLQLDFHKNRNKSVIFDAAAIYMALDGSLLEYQTLPLICDDEGFLRINKDGHNVKCALNWKDLNSYLKILKNNLF